jgi:hypothetical protein
MTPQEKAKDLVDKYDNTLTYLESKSKAKQCALIAVDEMILVLPFTDTNVSLNEYAIHLQKYLQQVKQEIEKL